MMTLPLVLLASGLAQEVTPLNVKPGLWETTTTSERSGMPAIPQDKLDKMPAEQRARIEAMMSNKPSATTRQSCHTDKDLRPFTEGSNPTCKQTIVTSTGTKQEVKMECPNGSGTVTIEAKDSEHVSGLVVVHAGANGRSMDMKTTITAKWLSSDCGDVKPANGKK